MIKPKERKIMTTPQAKLTLPLRGGPDDGFNGVKELQENVSDKRMLLGQLVSPIVKLSLKPMKTRLYGIKPRPWFKPERWVELNAGNAAPQIEHQPESENPAPAESEPDFD